MFISDNMDLDQIRQLVERRRQQVDQEQEISKLQENELHELDTTLTNKEEELRRLEKIKYEQDVKEAQEQLKKIEEQLEQEKNKRVVREYNLSKQKQRIAQKQQKIDVLLVEVNKHK